MSLYLSTTYDDTLLAADVKLVIGRGAGTGLAKPATSVGTGLAKPAKSVGAGLAKPASSVAAGTGLGALTGL